MAIDGQECPSYLPGLQRWGLIRFRQYPVSRTGRGVTGSATPTRSSSIQQFDPRWE